MTDTSVTQGNRSSASRLRIYPSGMSLGGLISISYVLCVAFDLLFPEHAMYTVWKKLLPGFVWLSWSSFFLGLVETFFYGWYIAIVFIPIYNFLLKRTK